MITPLAPAARPGIDAWHTEQNEYTRNTMRAFLLWCSASKLTRPSGCPPVHIRRATPMPQPERLELIGQLLTDPDLPLRTRVAGVIVLLYAQPLSRVVRLTLDDVGHSNDQTFLPESAVGRMNLLLRRKGTQRDLGQRPAREREQSLADDVLKPIKILRQHVEQEVLDFPVGPFDQDEAAITGLGRTLKKDRAQRPRRIVGQALIKPSRLASPAEVEALALRTQLYEDLLVHTLDLFGDVQRHEGRLSTNGQNARGCQHRP
ncbi:hypothetical protein ACIOHC_42945 [Streptomyces sp. NPDC088252]|uniref:hypothetical protein n=1 Tax=Streptomyces sp. NPDC088252 TaxID=3365845 RepID=UPI00381E0F4D